VKHYLLSVLQPADGQPPSPDELAAIGQHLEAFHAELVDAGAWVFAGGLDALADAKVVRAAADDTDDTVVSDGPYAETKEYLGGLCIIAAPDGATALAWARKASAAATLPVEVRAFMGDSPG
jgi:hypothetical protein